MADTWYDDYWAALKAVIHQAWPEVPGGQLFNENNLARKDWQNLLNDKELVGPWVAVEIEFAPTSDWPINIPTYEVQPTIWYIAPLSAAAPPQTMTAYLIDRTQALRPVLSAATTLDTVLKEMPLNASSKNDVNRSLLDAKLPWQAVSLTPTCIVRLP